LLGWNCVSVCIPSSLPKGAFYFVQVPSFFSCLDYSDPVGWFGCYVVGILSSGEWDGVWPVSCFRAWDGFEHELDGFTGSILLKLGIFNLRIDVFIH
jgi:hypothetical protein